MAKKTPKGSYPNAAPKDHAYGSIVVVSSVASQSGGTYDHSKCYVAIADVQGRLLGYVILLKSSALPIEPSGRTILTPPLGPAFTISSHAALGVVKSGVATLKGTGIRINCKSIFTLTLSSSYTTELSIIVQADRHCYSV